MEANERFINCIRNQLNVDVIYYYTHKFDAQTGWIAAINRTCNNTTRDTMKFFNIFVKNFSNLLQKYKESNAEIKKLRDINTQVMSGDSIEP